MSDSEAAPDEFVPDPQVRRELGGITEMTQHRWEHDDRLAFPKKIQIRGRNFRSRRELEDFKRRMISQAVTAMAAAEPRGAVGRNVERKKAREKKEQAK